MIHKFFIDSLEFDILLTMFLGFVFGALSYSIEVTIIFLLITECIIISTTDNYINSFNIRIMLTIIYLFFWVFGRFMYQASTGFERYYFWEW